MKFNAFVCLTVLAASSAAFADSDEAVVKKEGPCKQIKEACEKAGFIKGDAKEGKGLWVNCINPLVQGTTSDKAKLSLPSVPADTISACKAKHPKFGSGKVAQSKASSSK